MSNKFVQGLRELGYAVTEHGDGRITFPYKVEVGRFEGQQITLGFNAPADFPFSTPSGPNLSPRLLPLNTNSQAHPEGGVHAADAFGPDWEYWSRPHPNWAETDKSISAYMRHITSLFASQ